MKKKVAVIALICVVFVLLAILAGYMILTRGGSYVKSKSDYSSDNTIYFLQNDPQWADEQLGNSSFMMAGSGCLTTCIATELLMQHIQVPEMQNVTESDSGTAITPGSLNEFFSKQGVYDSEGNIQWTELEKALSVQVVKLKSDGLTHYKLDTLLSEGVFPIAYVRVNGNGNYHFVLIIGSKDGEYFCMDPLNENKDAVPLSRFGDKIYSIRYITEKTT
ncbi:hypothetical protein IZU99_02850 [Oscillospiraceae bacterium CM]|nr:hypothetical protein IZU99_02850 [Oscillospiraceae bacterium CM]